MCCIYKPLDGITCLAGCLDTRRKLMGRTGCNGNIWLSSYSIFVYVKPRQLGEETRSTS